MPSVLVFQHIPHETLGSLESCFQEVGLAWKYLEMFGPVPQDIDLSAVAGLVVLGGPMNVDEVDQYPFLAAEIGWIRRAVQAGLPYLGSSAGTIIAISAVPSATSCGCWVSTGLIAPLKYTLIPIKPLPSSLTASTNGLIVVW